MRSRPSSGTPLNTYSGYLIHKWGPFSSSDGRVSAIAKANGLYSLHPGRNKHDFCAVIPAERHEGSTTEVRVAIYIYIQTSYDGRRMRTCMYG